MTWEDRNRYREEREELERFRARLEAEDPEAPLTRGEARELVGLLARFVDRMSPERWDRALEAIAEEAARRADYLAARRN
ncbi:MAG: hypothetical protein RRA92_01215 [Gemmatimonadota bacterium]|nr:hypothetical protein [Gemmatimonadota bacterium]